MKYIQTIILVLLSGFVFGQEAKITEANNLYTSEQYKKAIDAYNEILRMGKESAGLYYNLGNAYYKAGDYNNAILNYERAKLLAPNDEDIDFNLKIANQHVVTSIEPLPQPFFKKWKTSIINMNSADGWAKISIVTFLLFLGLLGLYIFGNSSVIKKISFIGGIVLIVCSLSAFSFASSQSKNQKIRNHAIVFNPRVTVKSAPSETSTDLFLIYEGLKVQVVDSSGNWTEVRLLDGNQGWLPTSAIVRI
jgi:tetratricopeptide (TPR) repeat protein